MDTNSQDLSDQINVLSIFPSYYDPTIDQICFRDGIRALTCKPTDIVSLDTAERFALTGLMQSTVHAPGGMQMVLYAMLAQFDSALHNPPSEDKDKGRSLKDRAAGHWSILAGKGRGMTVKDSDIDSRVIGAKIAQRLHVPEVTSREDECYRKWLEKNGMGDKEVNTVLNEIYVRHVANVVGKERKEWEMEGGTGCTGNPPASKDLGDLVKDKGFASHFQGKGGKDKRDVMGFEEDDMKVYHPVHGTHLDDPWENHRHHHHGHHVYVGEYGSRKRSIGGDYLVSHKHHRRGAQQQQQQGGGNVDPSNFLPPGTDASSYYNGLPSAPTTDPTTSSSGSALTSKPHGFASSVTGGGSQTPVIPRSPAELQKLLTDPAPRVIHLDRTYDFRGTAGTCNNCAGCIPEYYSKCPGKGQLAIDNGQGWCSGKPPHPVTYDKAGLDPIRMGPNKSVIGITPDAGIRGKGLLIAHVKNVQLQGFVVDNINPEYIWGGDGVTIRDSDLVWIDRLTFRLIGRQFIVTGYQSAGRVTISNCFFDCETKWSSTCDNSHYWTVLGYGKSDKVTFSGNLMKHCSGRSPRIANPDNQGGDSVWHVVNSAFLGSTGHSFDMGPGISALIEGNVFDDVAQTSLHESSPGRAFAPSDKSVCTQCKGVLGRDCQPNAYSRANPIPSTTSAGVVLKDVAGEKLVKALPPGQVKEHIGNTAGCNGAKAAGVGDAGEPEGYGDAAGASAGGEGQSGPNVGAGAETNPSGTSGESDAGAGTAEGTAPYTPGQQNPANPGQQDGSNPAQNNAGAGGVINPAGSSGQTNAGAGTPQGATPYIPGQQNPANPGPQANPNPVQQQPQPQPQPQPGANPVIGGDSGAYNPTAASSQPESYGQPQPQQQKQAQNQQQKQAEQQKQQAEQQKKQQQQQQQKQQVEEQKKQQHKREQEEKKKQEQWQKQQQEQH